MHGYLALLRRPEARGLVAASLTGRLSFGVFDLALVVLAERATGSFAVAGLAVAAHAAGIAVSAPVRGRLLDRRGARRVVPPLAAAHAALVAALAFAPGAGIVVLALLAGLLVPPLVPAMRLEWQRLLGLGSPPLDRAYALDTVMQIGVYVVGPLVAAALIVVSGPRLAVVVAALLVLAGALAFARRARAVPDRGTTPARGLGAIRAPGVVTLFLVGALTDSALGAVDLAVVAAADEQGAPAAAGVLLAVFTAGSVAGGAVYGARVWSASPAARLGLTSAGMAVALAAVAAATGTPALLGLLLAVAGAASAARWVASATVLDTVAPSGAGAEAYTWLSSANAVGIAFGGVAGGAVIEAAGADGAFLAAAALAALGAAVVPLRRRSLAPA
jgi:MFS family permease